MPNKRVKCREICLTTRLEVKPLDWRLNHWTESLTSWQAVYTPVRRLNLLAKAFTPLFEGGSALLEGGDALFTTGNGLINAGASLINRADSLYNGGNSMFRLIVVDTGLALLTFQAP